MRVISSAETSQGITLRIDAPSRRYADALFTARCAPDLLSRNLFPNMKEWTESCAAFAAVRKELGAGRFQDPGVTLVDVGCGAVPRTAALFAFMTRWRCLGVDPRVRARDYDVRRLEVHQSRIEDMVLPRGFTVVVAVHSHAPLPGTVRQVRGPGVIVAMPCCVPLALERPPDVEYEDHGCWSPHRTVRVWRLKEPVAG